MMGKLQERVNAFFYMLYHYADIIVNTEGGTHMLFINRRGSPWMNNFAAAERWLNQQENVQQNLDNIKRPNIKWVFMKFFNVDVKVKTASPSTWQLLLHWPIAAQLHNLVHRCAGAMVALDTVSLRLHCYSQGGTVR